MSKDNYTENDGVCDIKNIRLVDCDIVGPADGYLKHPLVQFCIWGHWLYDDYLGRYYDYDLQAYVYYDQEAGH